MTSTRLGRWGHVLRTPVGIFAVAGIATIVLLAVFAPMLWSYEAAQFDLNAANQGASLAHPLGTDNLGRDILKRVLVATRLSVTGSNPCGRACAGALVREDSRSHTRRA